MSQIQKQGFWNTVLSYLGAGIGVINLIFLFPFILKTDEIGLIRILGSVSIFYAQIASLGFQNVIIRFYPQYRKKGAGFPFMVLTFATAGFILTTALVLLLRPVILPLYEDGSELFVEYYNWLVPLAMFVLYFVIAESFLKSAYKTIFTLFLKEVLLRILTLAGVLLVAGGLIDFELFIVIYLISHALILVLAILPLLRSTKIDFRPVASFFQWRRVRQITKYGFISLLTGATTYFVQVIDSLMIGAWMDLDQVGIYTIAFFMGAVIAMPARGISRIAVPMVAAAWKQKRPDRIRTLYRNTSWLQFSVGLFLLIAIFISLDDIFTFLPPEFAAGMIVVVLIGIGHLIDMSGGLNGFILNTSAKYDRDLYFNILFVVFSIVANIALIPPYGLTGAALASALSFLTINVVRIVYLWFAFRMQPFSKPWFRSAIIMIAAAPPAVLLSPDSGMPLFNIAVRFALYLGSVALTLHFSGTMELIKSSLMEIRQNEDTVESK